MPDEKKQELICEIDNDNSERKHILVVDDDPIMLKLIRAYLQDDYKVSVVNSGKIAIEFLLKYKPDLILLDYMMPLYNGATVLKIIQSRETTKDIPVFFLTGKTDLGTVSECLSYHPAGYIVKPVAKAALLEKLHNFFAEQPYQTIKDRIRNRNREKGI